MERRMDQRGFGALEMVLAVLLLVAIGAAGYFAYQARQAQRDPVANVGTPKNAQSVESSNAGASWKTYKSNYEMTSFRYPANWTVKAETIPNLPNVPEAKMVTLRSPQGFELHYFDVLTGLGGGCPETDPNVTFTTVQGLEHTNPKLYFIENESILALTDENSWRDKKPHTGDSGDCLFYPLFLSKIHKGGQMSFATAIQIRPNAEPLKASKVDLANARLILESFTY
ncbi:MAG TPA: hypothetical protein VF272_01940 [Candidatus Saccharimonadia bacterium]